MTYYIANYQPKSKKELKEAVASGKQLQPLEMNVMGDMLVTTSRKVCVCGPRYPKAHKWYAEVTTDDNGVITKVK